MIHEIKTEFETLAQTLDRQLAALQRDDLVSAHEYLRRAGDLCMSLSRQGAFEMSDFAQQRDKVAQLYRRLELALRGRMEHDRHRIRDVRKAGKALRAYDQSRI